MLYFRGNDMISRWRRGQNSLDCGVDAFGSTAREDDLIRVGGAKKNSDRVARLLNFLANLSPQQMWAGRVSKLMGEVGPHGREDPLIHPCCSIVIEIDTFHYSPVAPLDFR